MVSLKKIETHSITKLFHLPFLFASSSMFPKIQPGQPYANFCLSFVLLMMFPLKDRFVTSNNLKREPWCFRS